MNQEIERKFLVVALPNNLQEYSYEEIMQGYIVIDQDDGEVRLRKKGERYFQTVKAGTGKVRLETEIELTQEQFNSLWPTTEGKRIEKIRYAIPFGSHIIELDIYKGPLEGLFTAEVEFDPDQASERFELPAWLGKEVTEDRNYKNQNLALHGIPKDNPFIKP